MACVDEAGMDVGRQERKVLIITRLLQSFGEPVVSHLEFLPKFEAKPTDRGSHGSEPKSIEVQERAYAEKVCNDVSTKFCLQFVEFNSAAWKWHIETITEPK